MQIQNTHERLLLASPAEVGSLIDSLAGPDDRLWPADRWPAMHLDNGLAAGAQGGHGPIRYTVESYVPGRLVRFRFTRPSGFDGTHSFTVEPAPGGAAVLRHDLEMRATGPAWFTWPVVFRPLHNALIEDALDRASAAVGGHDAAPRWSPWVRALRTIVQHSRRLPVPSRNGAEPPSRNGGAPDSTAMADLPDHAGADRPDHARADRPDHSGADAAADATAAADSAAADSAAGDATASGDSGWSMGSDARPANAAAPTFARGHDITPVQRPPVQSIVPLLPEHWPAVEAIYAAGIATRNATFETATPGWDVWDAAHLPTCRYVLLLDGVVAGWAALSPVSRRAAYQGVAEVSVYVTETHRGRGIGAQLMNAVITGSEQVGIWTLQSTVFPGNETTLRLHERFGFRQVGRREMIARLDGEWRDTLLLERRSRIVGVPADEATLPH
jgi:L-amino acid N-acyltransferase YncA